MSVFEKYWGRILLAGESVPLNFSAFRLDGEQPESNFRSDAGANNCNCCDYFTFDKGGDLILIEDTRLLKTIEAKRNEFKILQSTSTEFKNEYLENVIVMENVVKVYGSLFILYRWLILNKCLSGASSVSDPNTPIQFWLVANDFEMGAEKAWDRYKVIIQNALYGRLGQNFLKCVEVLPKDKFLKKMKKLKE